MREETMPVDKVAHKCTLDEGILGNVQIDKIGQLITPAVASPWPWAFVNAPLNKADKDPAGL